MFQHSGFHTGLGSHRTHRGLHLDPNKSAEDQLFSYYELANKEKASIASELHRRCATPNLRPGCAVAFRPRARFELSLAADELSSAALLGSMKETLSSLAESANRLPRGIASLQGIIKSVSPSDLVAPSPSDGIGDVLNRMEGGLK